MSNNPILATENVSILFGEYKAVDNVSFAIDANDCAGIIGPNGAGKTTFFNLLTGMYKPTTGRIRYHGEDVTALPPEKRVARGLIRTFQLVSVYDTLTVLQNVILPVVRFRREYARKSEFFFGSALTPDISELCIEHLDRVGIAARADDPAANLSYGEKRKLEITMAMAMNPEVLLLDEPLAGLSDVEIQEITNLVRSVLGEFTILMIEHKISQIQDLVSRLNVMHEGSMIAHGTPAEIIHDKEIRRIYWGAAPEEPQKGRA